VSSTSPPLLKRLSEVDVAGIHLAQNIFIATTLLWLIYGVLEGLNPIWAISSMLAASEPKVEEALKFFHGRLTNALIGCATGLLFLFVGGTSEWKIPFALSASVLISTYVVKVPVMWRQAPITSAIVVAGGLGANAKMDGLHQGLKRVSEVLLGCVVGLLVTFLMSKLRPAAAQITARAVSAHQGGSVMNRNSLR
jgi:uncharacterized membrane protein YccC